MAEILEFDQMFYTNFDPKLKNQFILELDGIPSYMIKVAKKPSIEFDKITLDHINVKRHVKGKGTWGDINLTLYDPLVASGAQAVMDWVRTSHESITGRDGYASMYKKDFDMYQLDPLGAKVENWKIKGGFITSADFGGLDWSASDVVEIELTISVDYCVLEF